MICREAEPIVESTEHQDWQVAEELPNSLPYTEQIIEQKRGGP
jgi:hypothetical protein